jgi:hypothetical protein
VYAALGTRDKRVWEYIGDMNHIVGNAGNESLYSIKCQIREILMGEYFQLKYIQYVIESSRKR